MVVLVLFWFWCLVVADERNKGVNDCIVNKTQEVNVSVTYSEPYEDRRYRFCWSIPPRCSYTITRYRTSRKIETRNITKQSISCCEGYKKEVQSIIFENEAYPFCVAKCYDLCGPHGICIEPNKCLCESGQVHQSCIFDTTTYNNEFTTTTLSNSQQFASFKSINTNGTTFTESSESTTSREFSESTDTSESKKIIESTETEESTENIAHTTTTEDSNFPRENLATEDYDDDAIPSEPQYILFDDGVTENSTSNASDITTAKSTEEKKENVIQGIQFTTIVLTIIGVIFTVFLVLGILLIIYWKNIVCGKYRIPRRSLKSENQKPTDIDLKGQKPDQISNSTLSLEPCNLEDDLKTQFEATSAQIEYAAVENSRHIH